VKGASKFVSIARAEMVEMVSKIQGAIDSVIESSAADTECLVIDTARELTYVRIQLEAALAEDEAQRLARIEGGAS
jgi:hypothetical protein